MNGVKGDNEQENIRAGLTLGLPIDRNNSVKFNASRGTTPLPAASSALSERRAVPLGDVRAWDAGGKFGDS